MPVHVRAESGSFNLQHNSMLVTPIICLVCTVPAEQADDDTTIAQAQLQCARWCPVQGHKQASALSPSDPLIVKQSTEKKFDNLASARSLATWCGLDLNKEADSKVPNRLYAVLWQQHNRPGLPWSCFSEPHNLPIHCCISEQRKCGSLCQIELLLARAR
jgi:hypothetical protein